MGIRKVKKADYIPWSAEEEDDLQEWAARYAHLSWKEKCEEYFRQHGKRRSINSLRSKLEQLEKGIRRRRPVGHRATQRAGPAKHHSRCRQRSFLETIPAAPPPLIFQSPDPYARQVLQQWHQVEADGNFALTERAPSSEEEPMSPMTPLSLGGSSSPNNITKEVFYERASESLFVSQQPWRPSDMNAGRLGIA
ncbi:uncharacterized protein N7484_008188 [Penicillium longicatenatum]|uniref:uncharacterized protein n=1 Tax=Penicillium longicatenatum TaxID=1561947 RepID=UPI002547CBC9|nr:uncharacterized protein N7484_008188 [Penicillium longicatenatum]KAJ5640326.1 hypothetical protein N7484_008188 [Penicillium longicatenatum]